MVVDLVPILSFQRFLRRVVTEKKMKGRKRRKNMNKTKKQNNKRMSVRGRCKACTSSSVKSIYIL